MNKLNSKSSKLPGTTGTSQGTGAAATGDKSQSTSGMIFRVLAPTKRESLEAAHHVTSSAKKRQLKHAGATSTGRVAAMNQTTQPTSNMRNFSSAIKKSSGAHIPLKDNLTPGESS